MTTPTQATDELQALRAFAQDVMEDWPEGAPDGFDLQELAVKHGLLKLADPAPTEPCRKNCWCAEYFGPTEWAGGVQCFRKTALLTDSESSDLARLRAANAALTEALWGCIAAMERTQHIDEAGRIAAADAARVVLSSLEG